MTNDARARAAAKAALDGWTRLQEKRCEEGEWVQLRDLFTVAIADAVAQAVKERDAGLAQAFKERDTAWENNAALREEIARLRARHEDMLTTLQATAKDAIKAQDEKKAAVAAERERLLNAGRRQHRPHCSGPSPCDGCKLLEALRTAGDGGERSS